jgi:DNA polymerase III subunit beta
MKLECNINTLLRVVDKASRATGKNLTLPVLSCLYLSADKDKGLLSVKSTNLDIGSQFETKVNCSESGVVAVPAITLLNLLSSIKNDSEIKISLNNNNLEIESKNNTSKINCFPVDDFPSIPEVDKTNKVEIKIKDLVYGLKSVWYSASVSSIKPELSSIYIYPGDQSLIFVATDSFRLAEKKIHFKKTTDFQPILLPYKNIPDIIKILEGIDEDLTVYFDKNQIGMYFGPNHIISRVIEGSFPDYRQIIPKTNDTEVVLLKEDLIKTIKLAQVFSDNLNQIKFIIKNTDKSIELAAKNNEVGEYKENIPAKITGSDLEINFNHKYIMDAMQSIDSDSLTLSFSGMGKPMIIRGGGDGSFMYLVMPMNR